MRVPTALVSVCLACCNSPRTAMFDLDPQSGSQRDAIRGDRGTADSRPAPKLEPGDEAPAVEMTLQDGRTVSLDELRGKHVVLFFYPMDDTPGCRAEARGFRDHHEQFLERNGVVLGISLQGAESHKAFIEKEQLPFDLVVDNQAAVSKAFGVPIHGSFAARQTFLLDEAGHVTSVWRQVSPREHAGEVLSSLVENLPN